MRIILKIVCFIFLFGFSVHGQDKHFDSLREVLRTTKIDTVKVKTLSRFAFDYSKIDPDSSIIMANEALAITKKKNFVLLEARILHDLSFYYSNFGKYDTAIKINYKCISSFEKAEKLAANDKELRSILRSKAKTISNIGDIYSRLGDYQRAIEFHTKSLAITVKIKDTLYQANSLRGIGLAYSRSSDFPNALHNYLEALKLIESSKNKNMESSILDGIGTVYSEQRDLDKAISYYLKALKINVDLKDDQGIAPICGNIAGAYYQKHEYSLAIIFLKRANKIAIESKNKRLILSNMVSMGSVYQDLGDSLKNAGNILDAKVKYDDAMKYYQEAKGICENMKSKSVLAIINGNIGSLYFTQKKYKDAKPYLVRALESATQIGDLEGLRQYNEFLSIICNDEKDYKQALLYYKNSISAADTINNEENTKKMVRSEMNFEFEKKESANKAEQEKKEAIASEENKRQKIVIWSICCLLSLVLLFAVFVYRNFLQKQKINIEISHQKKIIEEKQKEVLDSIYYARRIQRALITSETYIENSIRRLLGKNN